MKQAVLHSGNLELISPHGESCQRKSERFIAATQIHAHAITSHLFSTATLTYTRPSELGVEVHPAAVFILVPSVGGLTSALVQGSPGAAVSL